ncbi:MAG TPA: FAD binding domain-containing protein [Stellaceae bacterium]|nr:FAD binding domain-containing protein [Stellaceae bacterium]
MENQSHPPLRHAVVIGGSLGGLFSGLLLRSIGWNVDIFERSPHDLDSRGGGIVLQPDVLQAFRRSGVRYDTTLGVEAAERIYLDREGGIAHRIPMRQMMTSWTSLYAAMRRAFSADHYHQGAELVGFDQDQDGVLACFADGRQARGDLLVGADGGNSFVRRQLIPDVRADYAGYIAWCGLIEEPDLPEAAAALLRDRFSFFEYPNSHMLVYLVPGAHEAIAPGQRRYNWVWYRNATEARRTDLLTDRDGRQRTSSVPPGLISAAAETDLRQAAVRDLPPPFRMLVDATHEPFLQSIQDLSVRRMAIGRIALIGDAAFIPRPHTAASTAKAAANALGLADALKRNGDIVAALRAWEPDQIQYGLHLRRQGTAFGNKSQNSYPEPANA